MTTIAGTMAMSLVICLLNLCYNDSVPEEDCGGYQQDGSVHGKRRIQGKSGVDKIVLAGSALPLGGLSDVSRLNERRVQIEIVRHHRRPQDANGHIETLRAQTRYEACDDFGPHRTRQEHFDPKTNPDRRDKHENERFHLPDAELLYHQEQHRIKTRDDDPVKDRHLEKKIQPDRRSQNFGEVARRNGDFAEYPECKCDGLRVMLTARLCEIPSGHDPHARGKSLEKDCHQGRHQQYPDKLVPEPRPAFKIGRPVPGIHVTYAHEIRRTCKGEHFPYDAGALRNLNTPVNL